MTSRDSFDPILSGTPLSVWDFGGASERSTGHTTVVYLTENALAEPARAFVGRRPGWRQRLDQQFWRYEIDVAHHPTYVRLELPAAEEAFSFTAKVCFTWAVTDPVTVARYGIRDTKAVIWPYLDQTLRAVSRQFSIEECGSAEEEMNQRIRKEPGDVDYGIRVTSCAVDLFLDAEAHQHLARRFDARRSQERARESHELQVLHERHARVEADLRGEMESAAATHELELKRQRSDFYRKAIEGGSFGFLVLQLIENPSDIKAVVEMLHAGRTTHFDQVRAVVKDILDRELVDSGDVDPLREHAMGQLRQALDISSPHGPVVIERQQTKVMAAAVVSQESENTTIRPA
jgi:hypothetical protein